MRLPSALVVSALASISLASPFKRANGLAVEVFGPGASISSVDELKFTATVTNSGSEDVKALKYGTILDNRPTRSFSVTKDGSDIDFQGVKISVTFNDNAYTTIASGETLSVEHDLSKLYNYASAGIGKFEFTPNTAFQVPGTSLSVNVETISVEITDDVAKRTFGTAESSSVARQFDNHFNVTCADSDRVDFLTASYTEAKELASIASAYASNGGPLLDPYFGSDNDTASSVIRILAPIAEENDAEFTLDCTDPYEICDEDTIAYTLGGTTTVFYCNLFFEEVETQKLCGSVTVNDRDIRGGTTLHELTHVFSGTADLTYGCANDLALSPSDRIRNADNFNCFATQVYQDTKC